MLIKLTEDNLFELDNSFMDKKVVLDNFRTNPFAKYLILKENEEVLGYIYYSEIYERAEINQIEIKEKYRNQKKGTILLKGFLKLISKDVTLEVKIDNKAAIRLYEKFDFKKRALRKGYYNGIDGILMERKYQNKND